MGPAMRKLTGFIAAMLAMACGPVGGLCKYDETPGTCTMLQVAGPDAGVETRFSFTPDGGVSTAASNLLTLGDGKKPSQSCVAANHLAAGSALACTRATITSGTCSPLTFELPTFNESAAGCP